MIIASMFSSVTSNDTLFIKSINQGSHVINLKDFSRTFKDC